jgi:hypothetical protein
MYNLKQGIMKRVFKLRNLLAITASVLIANTTFAQILTDYEDLAESSYQTAGTTARLYVEPDGVYSPTYDPATNGNINANARWTWTFAGLTATAPVVSGNAVAQNFVEFTNVAVGSYTVTVAESNTFAPCLDGSPESQVIEVIAAPTAAITTADPGEACGTQPAMTVNVTFTEAVPVALAGYAFAVNELVENIDIAGTTTATLTDNDGFIDYPTTGKINTSNDLTGAASPYGFAFTTSALAVQNNLRTKYTYTLIKASDAPLAEPNGVISAISQKSDYPNHATPNTYAFNANNQIVIIVNPTPVTGPIYHIPNDFAY